MAEPTKTITIDVNKLPKGVDPTKILQIVESAQKASERSLHYNEIRRKAQSDLTKMFPKEYATLLKKWHEQLD